MNVIQKRTLTITCGEGETVERKHHVCFISNLIADISKETPQIQWYRSNSKDGIIYCSNGLAEGTLMTLQMLTDKPGVEFTYNRHGKRIYTAVETDGDVNCPMHLAHLLHKVICAVTMAKATQQQNPLKEVMDSLRPKSERKEYAINVGDIFRSLDVEDILNVTLNQPTMLSLGISQSANCPERARREALIRATVFYLQHVQRKDTDILMTGFSLKHLSDGKRCGHLVTEPLSRVANAYVAIQEDQRYSHLKPEDANLQFAKDIIVNLLAGI